MGNTISLYSNLQFGGGENDEMPDNPNEKKVITLEDSLDFIATYYILTMDFTSLSRLHEQKYCEELVVLTSDIINKYFSDLEVKSLAKRIDSGVGTGTGTGTGETEKLVFFNKNDIDHLGIPDSEIKKGYCIEIAKFYIKIAHVFSAIVTTINPEYIYKDVFGNTIKRSLMQKSSIPESADVSVSKINLCSERINALKGSSDSNVQIGGQEKPKTESEEDSEKDSEKDSEQEPEIETKPNNNGDTIIIHPDVCSINLDKNGENNYLDEEPGINELIDLYFDGEYDLNTGKFMGMTTETEKQFYDDLKRFYLTFTDETEIPPEIKKFSDIKLRNYSKKTFCENAGNQSISVEGSYKDVLFVKYADNLKSMVKSVNVKQDELLKIINKIFVFVDDPVTNKEVIRVSPDLTDAELQSIIVETRNLIIELYLKCESDFVEGVKIYEAIVESQILDTTQKHIEQLEREKDKLINPYMPK